MFSGARSVRPDRLVASRLGTVYPERGVDLVGQDDAARIRVGLGGVEAVHHVGVADPVLEVDEPKRAAEATMPENPWVGSIDAALVEHVAQTPAMVGDPRAEHQIGVEAAL